MAIRFGNGFVIGTTGGGGGTNPYGVGPWKLNMSIAESNTTGIVFATMAFSFTDSPGYAVDWSPVTNRLNGGATYWQYGYLSSKQFTTPQTNLAVEGDTSFDAFDDDSRGITVIGDALVGDTSSPTLQNYDSFEASSGSNIQFGFTAAANTVIVIASGVESGGDTNIPRNITSITGLGLTWSLRKKYTDPNSNCGQQAEIWYAVNHDAINPVDGNITITYDNDFDDQIAIISSWEGCNLSSPWTSTSPATSNSNVTASGPTPTATPIPPTPTPSATSAPLTQFLPNGSIGPNGLITWLDYTTGINASNNLIDQSPFNNEFTYSGSNPWSNGVTGYTFTGGGSYASATSTTQYNQILNSFTIEMWVKIPSIPSTMSLLAAGGNNSGGWALRMDNSGTALNFVKYNVSDQTVYLNSQFQSNTWYHIVVAQGGTSLTYMVNGEIVGASNSGANNNLSIPNGTVNISKDFYTNTNVGLVLGSLKVYDYCRISSDITDDFNSSKGGYGFVVPTATPTSTESLPTGTPEPTPTGTPEPTPTGTPEPTPSSTPNHGFQYILIDRTNITGPFGTEFSLACEGLTCLGEETCTISGYSNHYFDNEDVSVGDYSYIDANSNVVASITDGYYILSDGELMAPVIFEFVSNQVASILTCPSPTNPPTATATQVLPTGTPGPTPTSTPDMTTLEIQVPPGSRFIVFNGTTYNSTTTINVVKNQVYAINTDNSVSTFWYYAGDNIDLPAAGSPNTIVYITGNTATLRVAFHGENVATPTPTVAPTGTPVSTPTSTPAPSGTPSPTSAPTGTPAPTGTSTPMPTSTSAPNPTPTATSASAPMTVTIYESGSNVVMSASGTVDLSGLTLVSSSVGPFGGGGLGINNATFVCGANGSSGTSYSGFTSVPSNFGSGSGLANSSGTGQAFGIIYDMAPPHLLIVPTGYTSGTNISSTQTFNNKTLSSLGLTIGTYTYTWSGGSIDVVVSGTPGPTGTPAPTSSGAGWNLFVTENTVINQPPLANGEILFYTTAGGPPRSTYNPNAGSANYLMIYKMDSAGTDYTTQFTNLQTNGGTINITQNGNTATYVASSGGQIMLDPSGFLLVSTALQTVTVASPFTYSDTITLTFS